MYSGQKQLCYTWLAWLAGVMVRNGRRRRNYMFLPKQVADYVTPGKNQILHLFRAISFALRSYTTTLHAEMQSIATIGQNSD
jgi:hypothetical protein